MPRPDIRPHRVKPISQEKDADSEQDDSARQLHSALDLLLDCATHIATSLDMPGGAVVGLGAPRQLILKRWPYRAKATAAPPSAPPISLQLRALYPAQVAPARSAPSLCRGRLLGE